MCNVLSGSHSEDQILSRLRILNKHVGVGNRHRQAQIMSQVSYSLNERNSWTNTKAVEVTVIDMEIKIR